MVLFDFLTSFVLGLLTPLTAVCVLPLYPGFLAYLANKISGKETDKKLFIVLGVVVSFGVILFMFLLGLVFTTLLQASLTTVISVVSPIAFFILVVISILLIFNVDFSRILPKYNAPVLKNLLLSAFVFGFFFGAIVVPCNPLFIAALFAKTATGMNFFINIINFLFFGLGIAFPLLLLAVISSAASQAMISFLTKYKKLINLIVGLIMLVISLYYLIFVFRVWELLL